MPLNWPKVVRTVTFLKYLAGAVSLIFLQKSLIWNKMTFSASNLLNSAYEEYLQNISPIFLFLSNLLLLVAKSLSLKNENPGHNILAPYNVSLQVQSHHK